jgi:hypothetical protein
VRLQVHAALVKPVAADALLFEVESLLNSHDFQIDVAL